MLRWMHRIEDVAKCRTAQYWWLVADTPVWLAGLRMFCFDPEAGRLLEVENLWV